jgi:hypothetical protein
MGWLAWVGLALGVISLVTGIVGIIVDAGIVVAEGEIATSVLGGILAGVSVATGVASTVIGYGPCKSSGSATSLACIGLDFGATGTLLGLAGSGPYGLALVGKWVEVPDAVTGALETVFTMTGLLAYTTGGASTMLGAGAAAAAPQNIACAAGGSLP